MPAARILILTSGPLSRNPRPLKEALTLARHGYTVTVITGFEGARLVAEDEALVTGSGITLLPLLPPPGFRGFTRRLRTALARRAVYHFGWQIASALGPAPALLHVARSIASDLVIAHNETALWAATRLHRSGRRVAADLEDWYSEDLLPAARRARPLRLLRALEHAALNTFDLAFTTSHALAAALQKTHGGRLATVVPNTFPLQPLAPPALNPTSSLVWFSQTVGTGRGLESFLRAWAQIAAPSRLTLVGRCADPYRQSLCALVRPEQLARLVFVDFVAPQDLPGLLARHDIGLALEPHEPLNKELTTSNKIYQYLNAGLAVIATPTAGQREVFTQAPAIGLIRALDDPAATAVALDAFVGDRARLLAARQAARTAAETRFSWEQTAPALLDAVAAALAR
ncbi:MAG: glycosyltransferase family 4 protein [Undibacterium sp.]|nr:glycosyltransferase family 4 protein [Opitutaceae bacterium]